MILWIVRAFSGERLKLNMNDYMEVKFPKAFQMAEKICKEIACSLKINLEEVEVGYFAIHIERVTSEESNSNIHHT